MINKGAHCGVVVIPGPQHGKMADLRQDHQLCPGNKPCHFVGMGPPNGFVIFARNNRARHRNCRHLINRPIRLCRPHIRNLGDEGVKPDGRGRHLTIVHRPKGTKHPTCRNWRVAILRPIRCLLHDQFLTALPRHVSSACEIGQNRRWVRPALHQDTTHGQFQPARHAGRAGGGHKPG